MIKNKEISRRIKESRDILTALGLPAEQRNERAAMTLLALLDMKPNTPWKEAGNPLMGVTPIMEFVAGYYGQKWAPNTRETIRRFTLHQFVQAGLVMPNPDEPKRPTNSPHFCYQIAPEALSVLRKYGSRKGTSGLREFAVKLGPLAKRYAQERDLERIPIKISKGRHYIPDPRRTE
jgi:hypothetical protein